MESSVQHSRDAIASSLSTNISTYHVKKACLSGKVCISGAKNSALRLLAASLLTSSTIELKNYPAGLLDANVHVEMLRALGKECVVSHDHIVITETSPLPSQLVYHGRSIRNTLLILGALTARLGSAMVPFPGGCKLGERKYDIHVHVLNCLGARVWEDGDNLCTEAPNGLIGNDVHLALRSTGATENAIICGVLAKGRTRIWNPHIRPEIRDLIAMLCDMGAHIEVRGQESIVIDGVQELSGAQHTIIPDNVEALTWLIGSVVTGGDVEIEGFPFAHLEVPLIYLRESGARFYRCDDRLIVRGGHCYPVDISTGPYPGINSDMQPLFAVYGALANGETRITDLRFPGRYAYSDELTKMGVGCKVVGDMLRIQGGADLVGTEVTAQDLRAGVALTIAGMASKGETIVRDAWQVERGYNDFVGKARKLNADIVAL
jgi:UDP-N-acetylglucosamine 1-carboxyvinyltransferase